MKDLRISAHCQNDDGKTQRFCLGGKRRYVDTQGVLRFEVVE